MSLRPFDLTPALQELGIRVIACPALTPLIPDEVLGTEGRGVTFERLALQEANVKSCVGGIPLNIEGNQKRGTPLFLLKYGEGDFLISLILISREFHSQIQREAIKDAICRVAVERLSRKANTSDEG